MTDNPNILKAEDYIEPRCVLCDEPYGAEPAAKSVPQRRIIEKMDEYMSTETSSLLAGGSQTRQGPAG